MRIKFVSEERSRWIYEREVDEEFLRLLRAIPRLMGYNFQTEADLKNFLDNSNDVPAIELVQSLIAQLCNKYIHEVEWENAEISID